MSFVLGDVPIAWEDAIPALVGVVALVGLAYWGDRTYRRWLAESHPLAGYRARVGLMQTGYRTKRANVSELAHFISDVLDEIARATATGSAR